ncbi:hypothetical protein C8R43DRAFT_1028523 [Mycena crocata]|nr:hypothetical protein C8R43DRAFT_1028523 [Mycena crocata]
MSFGFIPLLWLWVIVPVTVLCVVSRLCALKPKDLPFWRPILAQDLAAHRAIPLPRFPAPSPAELAKLDIKPFESLRLPPPQSPVANRQPYPAPASPNQQLLSPRQRQNAQRRLSYDSLSLPATPVLPYPTSPPRSPARDLARYRNRLNTTVRVDNPVLVEQLAEQAARLPPSSPIVIESASGTSRLDWGPPRSPLMQAGSVSSRVLVSPLGLATQARTPERFQDLTRMESVLLVRLPLLHPVPTSPQLQTIPSHKPASPTPVRSYSETWVPASPASDPPRAATPSSPRTLAPVSSRVSTPVSPRAPASLFLLPAPASPAAPTRAHPPAMFVFGEPMLPRTVVRRSFSFSSLPPVPEVPSTSDITASCPKEEYVPNHTKRRSMVVLPLLPAAEVPAAPSFEDENSHNVHEPVPDCESAEVESTAVQKGSVLPEDGPAPQVDSQVPEEDSQVLQGDDSQGDDGPAQREDDPALQGEVPMLQEDASCPLPLSDLHNTPTTPTRAKKQDIPVFKGSHLHLPTPAHLAALISPSKAPRHVDHGPDPVYHYHPKAPAVAIAKNIARPAQDDFKNFSMAIGAKFGAKGWAENGPNEFAPPLKKQKKKKKKAVGRVSKNTWIPPVVPARPRPDSATGRQLSRPPSPVSEFLPAFEQTKRANPVAGPSLPTTTPQHDEQPQVVIDLTIDTPAELLVNRECRPDCRDIYCPGGC